MQPWRTRTTGAPAARFRGAYSYILSLPWLSPSLVTWIRDPVAACSLEAADSAVGLDAQPIANVTASEAAERRIMRACLLRRGSGAQAERRISDRFFVRCN